MCHCFSESLTELLHYENGISIHCFLCINSILLKFLYLILSFLCFLGLMEFLKNSFWYWNFRICNITRVYSIKLNYLRGFTQLQGSKSFMNLFIVSIHCTTNIYIFILIKLFFIKILLPYQNWCGDPQFTGVKS